VLYVDSRRMVALMISGPCRQLEFHFTYSSLLISTTVKTIVLYPPDVSSPGVLFCTEVRGGGTGLWSLGRCMWNGGNRLQQFDSPLSKT